MMRTISLSLLLASLPACVHDDADAPSQITWRDQTFERVDHELPVATTASLAELPRAELAELLRPMLLTGSGTYVSTEPNWAAADAVLAPSRTIARTPRPDAAAERALDPEAALRRASHR